MINKEIKTTFKDKTNDIIETNREVVLSWESIKNGILQAVEEVLDKRKIVPQKSWMTKEMLALI